MPLKSSLRQQLESYVAAIKSTGTVQHWKKHLRSWPAFAAAGASSLAIVSSAGAGIIYSGIQNITATAVKTGSRNYGSLVVSTFRGQAGINIDGLGGNDFGIFADATQFNFTAGSVFSHGQVGLFPFGANQVLTSSFLKARNLSAGQMISAGVAGFTNDRGYLRSSFNPPFPSSFGNWPLPGVPGIAGIRFQQGADTHYGWIRLKWESASPLAGVPSQVTAIDWAYNDVAGAPIRAGEVPEPTTITIALLATGSAGVLAWRRRRKQLAVGAETAS